MELISRQAAIDALVSMTIYPKEELKEYREESAYKDCWTNGIYDAVEKIEKLPPIQPKPLQPWEVLVAQAVLPQPAEPKTGKWILGRSGAYCCSECMEPCAGYVMMKPRDKFCKMCGSRNEVTT